MSPFDRAFRTKAGRDISESEYLSIIGQSVLEWESEEKTRVQCALQQIGPALSRLFPAPRAPIYLVKTTGRGELSAHTRGNAIVLPKSVLASGQRFLRWMLAHEFFHVFSRNNPKPRSALYEAIGFRHCGKIELPVALRSRMITNPDAPTNEHCIRVTFSGKPVWAVPILHVPENGKASVSRWTGLPAVDVGLLLVEKDGPSDVARPILGTGGPLLVGVDRVSGFFEQVGRNTNYIIHPEEIVADNAALLTLGERNVPSPEILSRIATLLGEARARAPAPKRTAPKDSPAPKSDCADPG
jgi:hypothetical protein